MQDHYKRMCFGPSASQLVSCHAGNLDKVATRSCVTDALEMLVRMTHRGACGCESNTGDGAGCLVAIPHDFFARVVREDCDVRLPGPEQYAVGHLFLPKEPELYNAAKGIVAKCALDQSQAILASSLLAWPAEADRLYHVSSKSAAHLSGLSGDWDCSIEKWHSICYSPEHPAP